MTKNMASGPRAWCVLWNWYLLFIMLFRQFYPSFSPSSIFLLNNDGDKPTRQYKLINTGPSDWKVPRFQVRKPTRLEALPTVDKLKQQRKRSGPGPILNTMGTFWIFGNFLNFRELSEYLGTFWIFGNFMNFQELFKFFGNFGRSYQNSVVVPETFSLTGYYVWPSKKKSSDFPGTRHGA
jgi:hypothetical protein